MTQHERIRLLSGFGLLASGCGNYPLLETHSPDAAAIARFWWVLLAVTGIPAIVVIGLLLLALVRKERASDARHQARRSAWFIALGGGLLPTVIIFSLLIASVRLGSRVSAVQAPQAITIDVIGRQFWWEVRYPDLGINTANELHIPVGEQVRLRLSSGDVIHSFWVPQLHGKRDMIPGQINELWIQTDQSGVYRGQCAEFCGIQHALMLLEVVAHPPAEFDAWVESHRRFAAKPADPRGRRGLEVFYEAQCAHCHTIEGLTTTPAMGVVGPDLTHFASRRTIGAGVLSNNRGNLGGWILHPQALKPGNAMPPSTMAPDDLQALIHFLETLK